MKKPKAKVCPNCHKKFYPASSTQKFCTRRCYIDWQINNAKTNGDPSIYKTCPICGKKFYAKVSNQKYCSGECYTQSQKTLYKLKKQSEIERSDKKQGEKAKLAKMWNSNDPECRAVIEYLKTVKPIDWKEVYF